LRQASRFERRKGAAALKQQAIQYVALDVHQATLVVSVRDEQGSIVMRATVATEATAIVSLVRGLGSRSARHTFAPARATYQRSKV
jgi:hypothetical protein